MGMHRHQGQRALLEGLRFLKWLLCAGITGLLVGAAASVFHIGIDWATELRGEYPWLLYFLPVGGVVIVLLYRMCGMEQDRGTNLVITAVREAEPMRLRTAPLIFLATILTHLVGGSAGRPPCSWAAPWGPGWAGGSGWMRRTGGSWLCAACPQPSRPCSAPR